MNNKNIADLNLKKMLKKYGDYGVDNLFTIQLYLIFIIDLVKKNLAFVAKK